MAITEITFRCKQCKKRISCPTRMQGRTLPCPNCKTPLTIPSPDLDDDDDGHTLAHGDEEEDEGFGGGAKKENEFGELDLTPMVDVTMLLLIFFILTARYIEQKTLPTPPPSASQKEDSSGGSSSSQVEFDDIADASIVVTINERNNFLVDDVPVAPTDLIAKIRQSQTGGKAEIVIDAHPAAFHDTVVQVIDAANDLGIQKIRLTSKEGDDE